MSEADNMLDIYDIFRIELPEDFSPWECTIDELVSEIEQLLSREPVDMTPEEETRRLVFDEITDSLAKTLGRNQKDFQPDHRFQNIVPWYQRERLRSALIHRFDKRGGWLFCAEPGCGVIFLFFFFFFFSALIGAIFLSVFEKQPQLHFLAFLAAFASYITFCLLVRWFVMPFNRLPFHTISNAVDRIVAVIRSENEYVRAKYLGNREAIRNDLLHIFPTMNAMYPKSLKDSKLNMDFMKNYVDHPSFRRTGCGG